MKMTTKYNQDSEKSEKVCTAAHPYTCDCSTCITNLGNLPILMKVIEEQENIDQTTKPSTSSEKSNPVQPSSSMSCSSCGKNFVHRGDLNKHLRKHTKEQPYVCTVCKRKFAHSSNLNRHLQVHDGTRPFSCKTCMKTFGRKDKLEAHKKTKRCKNLSDKSIE
uniref:C2H2-type domain-containing protein n=1 Tax=Photinus pyralis TaxID=7054 RepID=A0A1Y1LS21_PHOPY